MAEEPKYKQYAQTYPDTVVLQQIGGFYDAFDDSAYLIALIKGYKLKKTNNGYKCGFPISSIDAIKPVLSERRVDYVLLKNGNELEHEQFPDNAYQALLSKAKEEVIPKEQERAKENAEKTEEQNNAFRPQQICIIEGTGIDLSNAILDLKSNVEQKLILQGKQIVSLSMLQDNPANGSMTIVRGLCVYYN